MEKESTDDGSKDNVELILRFEALDDILKEWFYFCRGELVGGRGWRRQEWRRERGKGKEGAKKFWGSNFPP